MIKGYAGKFLEVDLSRGKTKEIRFDEGVLKDYVGGRGLAARILWERLGHKWGKVRPLCPENLLVFLTGPLTGYYPGGRICVSGKSPQSNGVVGSTVGGEFGVELRCAGYDGIVVTGQSEEPAYLFIKDADVEIRDASQIWGKDAKQTMTLLTRECRELLGERYPLFGAWREPAMLYIGPAGENLARTAVVAAKWAHAAGYGGYGAVMGSKKLKAIAVKGTGPLPKAANMRKIERLIQELCNGVYENELWRRWGTGAGGYETGARTSSEPVRNWQDEWHDEKSFGVDKFEDRVWVKQCWSDFGCPTNCLKVSVVKTGEFKGAITDDPDYELQAYLGANLGIFTPEGNVYMASIIDDLGLCGIQTGNVLGFTAELYQRGILTEGELSGLKLKWGNAKAFGELARKIAYKEGIGGVLAEGTYRAALKLGKMKKMDLLPYAVQSKGIGIGAHGIRSGKDYPDVISYACSVQGGDHTSTAGLPIDGGGSELMEIFNDSGVYCNFNGFGVRSDFKFEFYRAVTGLPLTRKEWCGKRAIKTLQLQRAMLLLGGPDLKWKPKADDVNPPRFYEPLPSGPYKGRAADRAVAKKKTSEYYKAVGWDANGVPKTATLKKLGLADVDDAMQELRA